MVLFAISLEGTLLDDDQDAPERGFGRTVRTD